MNETKRTDHRIEKMLLTDVPEVASLERATFGQMAWHAQDFEAAISSSCDHPLVLRASEDPHIIGYAVLRILAPEAEIEDICIASAARQNGAGTDLMKHMLGLAEAEGVTRIFLEVRAHNDAARALYRNNGFVDSYVRKAYYQAPTDDAIIMMKEINHA